MAATLRPEELVDNTVVDAEGRKIGKVGTVYLSDESRQPEWVTVRTGLFGQKETFVPLQGAHLESDGVHVSVLKEQVSDAPHADTNSDLTGEESAELYNHYNLPAPRGAMPEESTTTEAGGRGSGISGTTGTTGTSETTGTPGMTGTTGTTSGTTDTTAGMTAGTSGTTGERGRTGEPRTPRSRAEGEAMTRSEERLRASTENVESGRVRLRKYVVTEEQQMTVPVSHEEVRIEREPVTGAESGTTYDIGEEEQEITLHREEAHVTKESVPVERVRLGKEKVTEEETISGEVRKEKFDIEEEGGRES
ncbi:DUF2382 domain-containing protein [Saccharomonospora glauca]|uniref:Conserved domain protein, TIGR02271 n=1 Tax=Saccharomonospora glauca K62 TaxID=928724 RepID=I1D3I8_9PSEU|nr:PRC and DUF2382 domain-containing protein [Saccharomonospora glauca]EIE99512.1 conserved domain protein, TIGR02271 [Saccharomonospora glauca K62]